MPRPSEICATCLAGITGCIAVSILAIFFLFIISFDLICLASTFYAKDVYEKCPQSNLSLFMTVYLVVPYMFLDKSKVIKFITKSKYANGEKKVKVSKAKSDTSFLDWLFSALLFFWGINEFKVSCVHLLKHSILYLMGMIITICSGIFCIGGLFVFCCAVATGAAREDPNQTAYNEYRLVDQSNQIDTA